MLNVLLTIHMIACIALVIAVMLQRSEGGALGMGGGGTGGLISGRGAASVLVRTTMGLALVFFITSIVMTRLNNESANQGSILERQVEETTTPFDSLGTTPSAPPPASTVPDPLGAAPPATSTTPAPESPAAPAADPLAPATTAPTAPAPTPENGGSPN